MRTDTSLIEDTMERYTREIAAMLHAAPTVYTAITMVKDALRLAADLNGHRAPRLMRVVEAIDFVERGKRS